MLLWQIVARDADSRLNTREGALEWLEEFAPGLWLKTTERRRGRVTPEPIHGWEFEDSDWQQWRRGVRAVRDIAQAREHREPPPASARRVADEFIGRHVRHCTLADAGLRPYLVRKKKGKKSVETMSAVTTDGRFDCPQVLMAYCLASMWDVNIAGFGGGRCPKCGQAIGNTPNGKPRSGLCVRCRAARWRAEHLDVARQRAAKSMKKYRRNKKKAASQPHTTNAKTR